MDYASCPIVAGAPNVLKAAFTKEVDFFATRGIEYVDPAVSFAEMTLTAKRMFHTWGPRLGITEDENDHAIAEAVKTFRNRASELLAERAGLACDGNDIIATTPRGYQLSPKLTVEVAVGAKPKGGKPPVPEKSDAEERKEWFLAQLRKGKRLTRRDYEKQFAVSIATAKRDLASLGPQISFVGSGEEGRYHLK